MNLMNPNSPINPNSFSNLIYPINLNNPIDPSRSNNPMNPNNYNSQLIELITIVSAIPIAPIVQFHLNSSKRPIQLIESLTDWLVGGPTAWLQYCRIHWVIDWLTDWLTNRLARSLARSLTHSPTGPLTHPVTHPLTHSFTHSLIHSFTHLRTHSPTQWLIDSLRPLIDWPVRSCTFLFTDSLIHRFTDSHWLTLIRLAHSLTATSRVAQGILCQVSHKQFFLKNLLQSLRSVPQADVLKESVTNHFRNFIDLLYGHAIVWLHSFGGIWCERVISHKQIYLRNLT